MKRLDARGFCPNPSLFRETNNGSYNSRLAYTTGPTTAITLAFIRYAPSAYLTMSSFQMIQWIHVLQTFMSNFFMTHRVS